MKRVLGVAISVLCLPLLAHGETPKPTAEPSPEMVKLHFQGRGKVTYEIRHRLHTVHGVSEEVEVRAVVGADGLQVMGRAPVRSFDSGNSNRDKHVLEAVRADRHPMVVVRGIARDFRLPKVGASAEILLRSQVELAGVASTPAIPATVEHREGGRLGVRFGFEDRLTDHDIERPKLLMIPVSDEFTVRGEFVLERNDAIATK